MDDPHLRFAWSTIDPSAPFAADAVATHWILVLRREAEAAAGRRPPAPELPRQKPPVVRGNPNTMPPAARVVAAPAMSAGTAPPETGNPVSGLLKRSEVLRLTGFSKSTLYDKIAGKTFPAQVSLGSRMSRWYESEVNEWLRNPR